MELQKLFVEKDAECLNALKMFRNLDAVVGLETSIGLALHFRELVHEALGVVMQDQAPFLRDAVTCTFLQYPRNTFMVEEFLACDILAFECGIPVGTADQKLKLALKDVIGSTADDAQLWSLLPTLTAATMLSKPWAESDYRTGVEGYRTNLHCVAKSLTQLVVVFKSLTTLTVFAAVVVKCCNAIWLFAIPLLNDFVFALSLTTRSPIAAILIDSSHAKQRSDLSRRCWPFFYFIRPPIPPVNHAGFLDVIRRFS